MMTHRHCQPPTYDAPVCATWTYPECGEVYESRPGSELSEFVRKLPGVEPWRTFWRGTAVRGRWGT